jgi:hypothetical protein
MSDTSCCSPSYHDRIHKIINITKHTVRTGFFTITLWSDIDWCNNTMLKATHSAGIISLTLLSSATPHIRCLTPIIPQIFITHNIHLWCFEDYHTKFELWCGVNRWCDTSELQNTPWDRYVTVKICFTTFPAAQCRVIPHQPVWGTWEWPQLQAGC